MNEKKFTRKVLFTHIHKKVQRKLTIVRHKNFPSVPATPETMRNDAKPRPKLPKAFQQNYSVQKSVLRAYLAGGRDAPGPMSCRAAGGQPVGTGLVCRQLRILPGHARQMCSLGRTRRARKCFVRLGIGQLASPGWAPDPRCAGGSVLHKPPWSFGFDSQTRGTRAC